MNNSNSMALCHMNAEEKKNYNKSYYQRNKSYWATYYLENVKGARNRKTGKRADDTVYGVKVKPSRVPGEDKFERDASVKILDLRQQKDSAVNNIRKTMTNDLAKTIGQERINILERAFTDVTDRLKTEAEKQKKKYRQSYIDQQYKKAAEKARMRQHFKTPVASVPVSSTLSAPAKLAYNTKQFLSKTVSSISSGLANLGEQLMKALKI